MSTTQLPSDSKDGLLAFFRGEVVPLADARVSVMTHALHYGTGIFEGIRGNWNQEKGVVYIYRLREHYERLLRGCRLMMLDIPYSLDDLCRITVDLAACPSSATLSVSAVCSTSNCSRMSESCCWRRIISSSAR